MSKNQLGVQKVLLRAGSLRRKKNWRISLVNFTSFRSISFNFIPFHPAPGGPEATKEGEVFPGGDFPTSCRFTLRLRTALILKLTYVFQPRLKSDIFISFLFYFTLLKGVWFR